MTPVDTAAARKLVAAVATDERWLRPSDAEFIATARTSVPAMADEIDSLRAQVKRVLDVCDQYVIYCYPSPVGDSSPDRVVLVEDIRRAVGDTQ